MTIKPTRKLAAAFAVAGAVALPLAGCGSTGTSAAPATVTVGPGGIATKAPGLCTIGGKYTKEVPVDCADPSERNPMPTFSREAQRRADEAAKSAGFPWWGWALAVGGVGVVGYLAWVFAVTAGPDVRAANAAAAARQAQPARPAPAVLDYDDFDDFDDDDDEPYEPPVAPAQAPAPAQPGGSSFLEELSRRLEAGQ